MLYFEIKNKDGIILISNINNCANCHCFYDNKNNRVGNLRSRYIEYNGYQFWLIIDKDEDLLKSGRLFKRIVELVVPSLDIFYKFFNDKLQNYTHSLKKIQGQMRQKMDSILDSGSGNTYEEFISNIETTIQQNPRIVAEVVFYLHKRIDDINAQIESYEVLALRDGKQINRQRHNLKKVLLRVLQPFYDDFKQADIYVEQINDINFDVVEILFDYKTFNVALYNIFDNCTKYIKPGSKLTISLEDDSSFYELSFAMMSMRIEKDEINRIFEEGYSGKNTGQSAGCGLGLFIAKEALRLNDMEIDIKPQYSDSELLNEKQYIKNKFIIKIKK